MPDHHSFGRFMKYRHKLPLAGPADDAPGAIEVS